MHIGRKPSRHPERLKVTGHIVNDRPRETRHSPAIHFRGENRGYPSAHSWFPRRSSRIIRQETSGTKKQTSIPSILATILGECSNPTRCNSLDDFCGCEVDSDNSTDGFVRLGYDGEDACAFDKDIMRWIALWPDFQRKILIGKEVSWNDLIIEGFFFVSSLILTLLTLAENPEVCIVIKRDGSQSLRLSCLVTGFYPQAIDVMWLRDGEGIHESESSDLLPNWDGTYQLKNTIEMSREDVAKSPCYIEHTTLQGVNVPQVALQ
ncbi:major histocompatibility complex class I-related gene protein-like [Leucoraja erinacea]|uniref:major histocompatibility complex class I-related gene protein-like n=1 Tax=Leucoraja erinaceus TaxID=7782 RepID=UPI002454A047|nr:major histocompatibility complex class I-related gene protein-like [Leucoraja erinacea]